MKPFYSDGLARVYQADVVEWARQICLLTTEPKCSIIKPSQRFAPD